MGRVLAVALASWVVGAAPGTSPRAAERPRLAIEPVRALYGHLLEGPFLEPAGVFYDTRANELYVCDRGAHRIAIADERGFPVFSFGSKQTLTSARQLVVDEKGRIFVADGGHPHIRVFDYDGASLPDRIVAGPWDTARPVRPSSLALSPDGTLFLIDTANRRILRGDLDNGPFEPLRTHAARRDLLVAPADLEIAPDGNLVVSDQRGLAVQVYSPEGRFLRGWGRHEVGIADFSHPAGVAVDEAGRVYVADTLRQDVKVFTAEGEFITNLGGFGVGRGQFQFPEDVATDRRGRVFVSERAGRRVQVFRVRELPDEGKDAAWAIPRIKPSPSPPRPRSTRSGPLAAADVTRW
jgi:sugar lactone lactonase YvrE